MYSRAKQTSKTVNEVLLLHRRWGRVPVKKTAMKTGNAILTFFVDIDWILIGSHADVNIFCFLLQSRKLWKYENNIFSDWGFLNFKELSKKESEPSKNAKETIWFLVACTRHYNPLCPSVGLSVGPLVRRSATLNFFFVVLSHFKLF